VIPLCQLTLSLSKDGERAYPAMNTNARLSHESRMYTESFGESGTFTPAGGTPRTINVIVDRAPAAMMTDNGVYVPRVRITACNHATRGILSSEVNQHGADRFSIPVMHGGTAESLGVYLPPPGTPGTQDAGMIVLDLR
jgi:hypothetical protein